jgi:D-alanyl-D-alanine carboxypeptidase (penicillin-binding protein 5/6)
MALLLALALGGVTSLRAAESSITIDAKTGFILEKLQPDKKRQIGSLTKIATAMVVLDWATRQGGDLAQVATIPQDAFVGSSENNVGFQPGDTITLRDLLYAALVQSDNIAAYTLADHVGRALQRLVPPGGEANARHTGRLLCASDECAGEALGNGADSFSQSKWS